MNTSETKKCIYCDMVEGSRTGSSKQNNCKHVFTVVKEGYE